MTRSLPTSAGCFVCGRWETNPTSLALDFSCHESGVVSEFQLGRGHQGYDGIVHGGVLSAILDEALCFAASAFGAKDQEGFLPITRELKVDFRAPVATEERYRVAAHVCGGEARLVRATAEIRAETGRLCATAEGLVLLVPRGIARQLRTGPELD